MTMTATTTIRERLASCCPLVADAIRNGDAGDLVWARDHLAALGYVRLMTCVDAFIFLATASEARVYSAHIRGLASDAIEDCRMLGPLADACQDDGSRDCMELLDAVETCQMFFSHN